VLRELLDVAVLLVVPPLRDVPVLLAVPVLLDVPVLDVPVLLVVRAEDGRADVRVVPEVSWRTARAAAGEPVIQLVSCPRARCAIIIPAPIAAATGHSIRPRTARAPSPP
jgi:hypothetical protein